MSARAQRGFSLLEVLVASALTIAVILAAGAAVTNALHGAALAEEKMALTDDALSALADVRALVAYDIVDRRRATKLQKLLGGSASMTLARTGAASEQITIRIVPLPGGAAALAYATVSADGLSVNEQQTLSVEAPAPGSAVQQN